MASATVAAAVDPNVMKAEVKMLLGTLQAKTGFLKESNNITPDIQSLLSGLTNSTPDNEKVTLVPSNRAYSTFTLEPKMFEVTKSKTKINGYEDEYDSCVKGDVIIVYAFLDQDMYLGLRIYDYMNGASDNPSMVAVSTDAVQDTSYWDKRKHRREVYVAKVAAHHDEIDKMLSYKAGQLVTVCTWQDYHSGWSWAYNHSTLACGKVNVQPENFKKYISRDN